ncbi:hypothetical protein ACHAP4_010954 [Fusarium culmorum]
MSTYRTQSDNLRREIDALRREQQEFRREQQEMFALIRSLQEERTPTVNFESRQQEQPDPDNQTNSQLPFKMQSDHQQQGPGSLSPPPKRKRKRTLPPSPKGDGILDQHPSTVIQRQWPLFGHLDSSTSGSAVDEDYEIHMKLRCKVGTRLEKWAVVGCQLCYVLNNTSLDHDLKSCTAAGSEAAQRILSWLETLHLERYAGNANQCSLCTETDQICEDMGIMIRRFNATTEEEKNHWTEKYLSAKDLDGFCQNKPAIRRTIAALGAVDGQVLGKAFTSFVSKRYNVDLTKKGQATKWFEEKVPLQDSWVPQLLAAFDLLVQAFEFVGAGGGDSSRDSGPSRVPGAPTLSVCWDDDQEVREWKVVMDWWLGKCSFCAGRGVQGPQIEHTLRKCPYGGKRVLRSGLAEAIYEEDFRACGGCRRCAMPREVCEAWEQDHSGAWCFREGVSCQYGRQAYDTAIGFFLCTDPRYRIELMEIMSDEGSEYDDEESVAVWLGEKITVTGIEACQMIRQLRAWSQIWLGKVQG